MNSKDTILLIAGLILGIGLGFALLFFRRATAQNPVSGNYPGLLISKGSLINTLAPDFTLEDLSGAAIELADFQGHVVLLNFWATWCAPCRLEMPELQKLSDQFSPNFHILGVNFDEPADVVGAYVEELGLTFDILLDPGGVVQDLYRVRNYPTSFFIDEQGIVRIQHIGILSENQLDRYLRQMGVIQ